MLENQITNRGLYLSKWIKLDFEMELNLEHLNTIMNSITRKLSEYISIKYKFNESCILF